MSASGPPRLRSGQRSPSSVPTRFTHRGRQTRRTHPSPAGQAPPAPPSSPRRGRPTGNDDREAVVEGPEAGRVKMVVTRELEGCGVELWRVRLHRREVVCVRWSVLAHFQPPEVEKDRYPDLSPASGSHVISSRPCLILGSL